MASHPLASLPPLNALRAFDAVCRGGSLAAAAKELHVTVSAVSRQMAILKVALPGPAFRRGIGGRLELTTEGEKFHTAVRAAFGNLEMAQTSWSQRATVRPLVIACPITLAAQWLIPRLARWYKLEPEVEISLMPLLDTGAGLRLSDIDAIIDVGRWPRDGDLVRRVIMPNRSGPVASPDYLRRCGPLHTPKDLSKITFLIDRDRPNLLEDWLEAVGHRTAVVPSRSIEFDHLFMAITAAVSGLGVTMGPEPYIKEMIQSGQLVAPFGLKKRSVPYYIAWSPAHSQNRRLKKFVEWLVETK